MGFEAVRETIEQSLAEPKSDAGTQSQGEGAQAASTSNGDSAPDSAIKAESSAQEVADIASLSKFKWEGKEWTIDELKKATLMQKDYTTKTQRLSEEKRKYEQEKQTWETQRTEREKYDGNIDYDIENVLKDPSLIQQFKDIYPPQYHARLDKALQSKFGVEGPNKPNESILDQRLKAMENRFHSQDRERQAQAFEVEVKHSAQMLESTVERLASKFPLADEEAVLAKAEFMSPQIKAGENYNESFSKMMENLYKADHDRHEKRYAEIYKAKVQSQKEANVRGRDAGKGGATPQQAPSKMKLKDVKTYIQNQYGKA